MARERFQMFLPNKEHWQKKAEEEEKTLSQLIIDALNEYDASQLPLNTRWTRIDYGIMFLLEDLQEIQKDRALNEAEQKFYSLINDLYDTINERRREIPRVIIR